MFAFPRHTKFRRQSEHRGKALEEEYGKQYPHSGLLDNGFKSALKQILQGLSFPHAAARKCKIRLLSQKPPLSQERPSWREPLQERNQ